MGSEYVDERLGGPGAIGFLVRARREGLQDTESLRRIDEFERWIEKSTHTT
jgi:hypothetical protein